MKNPEYVLTGSVANFLDAPGRNFLDRFQPLTDWLDACYEHALDPYCKASDGPILAGCKARDRLGRALEGINMASQDYFALSSHTREQIDRFIRILCEAAKDADAQLARLDLLPKGV